MQPFSTRVWNIVSWAMNRAYPTPPMTVCHAQPCVPPPLYVNDAWFDVLLLEKGIVPSPFPPAPLAPLPSMDHAAAVRKLRAMGVEGHVTPDMLGMTREERLATGIRDGSRPKAGAATVEDLARLPRRTYASKRRSVKKVLREKRGGQAIGL